MLYAQQAISQNVFGFSYYTNEKDSVVVTRVFKNSPAEKSGLKPGDILNFINDIPLAFKKKEFNTVGTKNEKIELVLPNQTLL